MDIRDSARKHGVSDEDIRHAWQNAMKVATRKRNNEVNDVALEAALNGIGPQDMRDAVHFRRIIAARQSIAEAEAELLAAVRAARAAGDSWTMIGVAMDTSRQGAYRRFAHQVRQREVH